MITEDRICKILYADWICSLRRAKDPDFDVKVETIKEIMNRFGVEGMDTFDEFVEDTWRRNAIFHQ